MISTTDGTPSLLELVGFALAAVTAFSMLNLLVARLLRSDRDGVTPTRALLIGTATDFPPVGTAMGTAFAIGGLVADGWAAWVRAPFAASVIYVVVQALELAGVVDRPMTRHDRWPAGIVATATCPGAAPGAAIREVEPARTHCSVGGPFRCRTRWPRCM